jgi:ATP-dependent DNA ligase
VISRDGKLDFDAMQMRLHPAESRIRKLSAEIPAQFIAFDVLLWNGKPIHELPLEKRRTHLEKTKGLTLSPTTRDRAEAEKWLDNLEAAGLDGVIAKRLGVAYKPGSREAVLKVKAHKTADCIVVGVRWKKDVPRRLATLLLGLYNDQGEIDYVGSAAVAATKHDEILALVEPLMKNAPDRRFSEPNRWGTGELEQTAVRPELVAEVRYDKLEKSRLRHGTKLLRFRPDKNPDQCTWKELRPPRRSGDPTVEGLLGTA